MAHIKSDLRNKILGNPCLEEESTVNDHRDNKDLILASKDGLIWEFNSAIYGVCIRNPRIINREFSLKGVERYVKGEELVIFTDEASAKEWKKKLNIPRSRKKQLREFNDYWNLKLGYFHRIDYDPNILVSGINAMIGRDFPRASELIKPISKIKGYDEFSECQSELFSCWNRIKQSINPHTLNERQYIVVTSIDAFVKGRFQYVYEEIDQACLTSKDYLRVEKIKNSNYGPVLYG